MIRNSKSKLIATLGPATNNKKMITRLLEEDVDVFRLNFSHGSIDEHIKTIHLIRELTDDIPILVDLPGPKIRIGSMKPESFLIPGTDFILSTKEREGDQFGASVTYKDLPKDLSIGSNICLADGLIQLEVTDIQNDTDIITQVKNGGLLTSGKGINAPDANLKVFFPSKKDIEILERTVDLEPDYYGLSFVRRIKDIEYIRNFLLDHNSRSGIISKVEHKDALKILDQLIDKSDAIMIARGDLGVEVPIKTIPHVQRDILRRCRTKAKPVIVATQILSSMVHSPIPTRAEVNDIANALNNGADALMLSEETAIGTFPILVVKTLKDIALETELYQENEKIETTEDIPDLLGETTKRISQKLDIAGILTNTRSGRTARFVAKYRPNKPIFSTTHDDCLYRQLNLIWGVQSLRVAETQSTDDLIYESLQTVIKEGYIKKKDTSVMVVGGTLFGQRSKTNFMQIIEVEKALKIRNESK